MITLAAHRSAIDRSIINELISYFTDEYTLGFNDNYYYTVEFKDPKLETFFILKYQHILL